MTVEPDYRNTSRRPPFEELPAPVRSAIEQVAGPVARAFPPVTTGFTGAYAGLLELRDGSHVFAKAAGPQAPHALLALPREAQVLAQLAGRATAPHLVGSGSVEEWEVIVLEAIEGHLPGMPWSPAEADAAHDACLALAALPASAVADLTDDSLADSVGADPAALACLAELASGERPWPDGIPPLTPARARELSELGQHARKALRGDHLVHSDLRPDNMLVDPAGRVRVLDWNWVARGPRWVDLVGLLPQMAHHGIDVASLVAGSPLLDGVADDDLDAFLAVIVGYMATHATHPAPPGTLHEVRLHQRHMAATFLALLATRRGWTSDDQATSRDSWPR